MRPGFQRAFRRSSGSRPRPRCAAKPARTPGRPAAAPRTFEARQPPPGWQTSQKLIDERARSSYFESAFSDALAIYLLSLAVDFDYHDLRERDYPLLAAPALAERLRHVAGLFPANQGYEFQVLYRRKG